MFRWISWMLLAGLLAPTALAQQPTWRDEDRKKWLEKHAEVDESVMVPMRDGVRLATDVYRPKTIKQTLPTIFWRTPYNFNELAGSRLRFVHESVARGYAFVIQNERGKFFSEGEWEILGLPRSDGYDALSWIADQSWSNGKVGTLGCSSSAEWQMALAAQDHPAHAAMVPMAPGAGIGRVGEFHEQGNWYRGGAEQMLFLPWLYGVQNTQRPRLPDGLEREDVVRLSRYYDLAPQMPDVDWHEKIRTLPFDQAMEQVEGPLGIFKQLAARTPSDPAWYRGGLWHDDEPIGVPGLWLFSWYDVSTAPNVAMVEHIRREGVDQETRQQQYMIMAPLVHCGFFRAQSPLTIGEREIEDVDYPYEERIYDFFDWKLKGTDNGFEAETPANAYFTFGIDRWQSAERWPPKGAKRTSLYLSSSDGANSLFGDGRLGAKPPQQAGHDRFSYDPLVPVPSLGGGVCCTGGAVEPGAFDQRPVEARADVLVYTSDPLDEPLEVTGPVHVILHVASSARDTDFTAKLVDVFPDGTAYNLDETIFRARYRQGYDQQLFFGGEDDVVELKLSGMVTSNVFGMGHRIRLEVSSSNFPRFARNLNTGGRNHDESEPVVARNTVHHSKTHPSRVELTVVPIRP